MYDEVYLSVLVSSEPRASLGTGARTHEQTGPLIHMAFRMPFTEASPSTSKSQ